MNIIPLEKHAPAILRRVSFLVREIKCDDRRYDQSVSVTLRALSNIATVGKDGTSPAIKKLNPRMSKAARALRNATSEKHWLANTINEHPTPLKVLWDRWVQMHDSLDERTVWLDLCNDPMVTITKAEDQRLKKMGLSAAGTIEDRYGRAGIEF